MVKFPKLILIVLLLGSGCSLTPQTRMLMPTPVGLVVGLPHPGGDFRAACACEDEEIPVFVISGRNLIDGDDELNPFGNKRSANPTLGVAYVKIGDGLTREQLREQTLTPAKRKTAKVEFRRFEISADHDAVESHLITDEVISHQPNPWIQQLSQQLDRSGKRDVCIFVHGYNTEFNDNTLLAAEIFHYLGRVGAMLSFEWPSESRLLGYLADKGHATYSTRHFRAMIANLATDCQVDSITIIAHSAGSPIVVNALREIRLIESRLSAEQVQQKYKIERVVLAAPDMDLLEFINGIHDRFYEITNGVAVYASPNDRALKISQLVNNNQRLGRAVGKLNDWEKEVIGQVPKLQMVDASRARRKPEGLTGHSYFHRDPWVSTDIGAFIVGLQPQGRGLERSEGDIFWRFPGDYTDRLKQLADNLKQRRQPNAIQPISLLTPLVTNSH